MSPPNDPRQDIDALYRATGHLVFRRCMRMLRNEQEAMDVTQWCYIRAIETGFEVRGLPQSLAWLYRTAGLRCLAHLRDESNRRRLLRMHAPELRAAPQPSAEGRIVSRDLMARALARVDDRDAEVALLHYGSGLSMKRVVEMTELSQASAYRARQRFEDVLKDLAEEES